MILAIKLAFRNLIGAGLRTWLNVIVLSFSFVVIIWMKGIMMGWDHQAKTDMTNWEIGGGQFWQKDYDPFDPFTFNESHAKIPSQFDARIEDGRMEPLLVAQGSVYPQGRIQPMRINGINPDQSILMLPTSKLDTTVTDAVPAVIGSMMAQSMRAKTGDRITLQWRDSFGAFDASEIYIVDVFTCNVPAVDIGQIYIPLSKLQSMMTLENEATIITYKDDHTPVDSVENWIPKSKSQLTASIDEIIKMKSSGQSVLYFVLLLLAMLAIFDTQVLSIFRRQKEIGTYVALGYTRSQVVGLFTVEGTMHSVLSALLSAAYGLPFLAWQAKAGWTIPIDASQFGMAMAQTLYPVYSVSLVISTILIIMTVTAIVSYWPSRKIAKMNPTEALRGKIQ